MRQIMGAIPLVVTFLGIVLAVSHCASSARADCTPAQKAAGDRELVLNTRDKNLSKRTNLLGGEPRSVNPTEGEVVLVQRDYVIRYDGDLLVPLWVAYRMDLGRMDKVKRVDCFRPDKRLREDRTARSSDYDEAIYDQGHMAPSEDMDMNMKSMINSTIFSNVTPQQCFFNRGTWLVLESMTRHWLKESGTLYVATGAIFDRDGDNERDDDTDANRMKSRNGKTRVAVATSFYKIFAWEREDGGWETLSILLPHKNIARAKDEIIPELETRVVRLKDIEKVSGIDWFPDLDTPIQEAAELWPHDNFNPSTLDALCRS